MNSESTPLNTMTTSYGEEGSSKMSLMKSSSKYRLLAMGVLLAFSSIFQMGYSNAYPNTAIAGFRAFLNNSISSGGTLTEESFGWIWSAVLNIYFLGFAIGSVLAVPVADRVGRKWCLVLGNFLNFISAIIASITICFSLPWIFLASRIVFALSAAVSMNSLILLLQESAPLEMRGLMSFNAEMAFVVMNMVGALAGMKIILGDYLKWLVGLTVIPTFFSVLVALWFRESPEFLIHQKGNRKAAAESVIFYRQTDVSETEIILDSIERTKTEDSGTIRELLSTSYVRKGLILGVVALQMTTSIWAILYYSTEFLHRANISYDDAEMVSTIMLFISSLSTVIGMILVERFGRRPLLLSCAFVNMCALTLFVVSAQLQPVYDPAKIGCIVAVVLHGVSYSIALGPISWFITAELVPLQFRALSQSVALSANQLTALVLGFITLPLYNIIGSWTLVPLYIVPGYICCGVLYLYLPETREKEIDEVIRVLQGGRQKAYVVDSPKEVVISKESQTASSH